MWKAVVRRLLMALPVLFFVTLIVFLLVELIPGDPALFILGQEATPEALEALRERMGLNQPLHIRYLDWIGSILQGDLGRSMVDRLPVIQVIASSFPITIELTLLALLIAFAIAIPAGVISATRQGTVADAVSSLLALGGISLPSFWLAILLIYAFALQVNWFPSSGYVRIEEDLWGNLYHLCLPALSLGVRTGGIFMRQIRSSMLDVSSQDFVRTARAKGLAERVVTYRHVLRNALLPVVTISGLQLAALLGGVVITETIFAIPGFGRLIYSSIIRNDFTTVQGAVLIFAVTVVIINFLVDVCYSWLDPRIQVSDDPA